MSKANTEYYCPICETQAEGDTVNLVSPGFLLNWTCPVCKTEFEIMMEYEELS